jgi:hypothetical protein
MVRFHPCLASLAPFLLAGSGGAARRDLNLLRSYVDLDDPKIEAAIKQYLDPDNPLFNRLKFCAFAFVGFNSSDYPDDQATGVLKTITEAVRQAFPIWRDHIGERIIAEKVEKFEIHVVCMPFHSVEAFRQRFLQELGLVDGKS